MTLNNVVHSAQNVSWNNVANFSQFLVNADSSAAGYLFESIDVMVILILFITIAATVGSWEVAILSAGFIGILLSILLVYLGLIDMMFTGVFIGAIIITIMIVIWSNRYD